MAINKTLNFLPGIFQTDTNKKFLSATLDQLVSEPDFTRLNSYVGRKFAPTYKSTDSYVTEVSKDRQSYQLEPSVIVKNKSNQIDFYSGYTDLINKLSYYGGKTDNHDRLFTNEYYTYNGLFDFDKFVNFSQYYWLPNGMLPVQVNPILLESQHTFVFSRNDTTNSFQIDTSISNPDITIVRGGLYKFQVNQPDSELWIQTEPGLTGTMQLVPNITSRSIYGIDNNGKSIGQIEFSVPLSDSQDEYLSMPVAASVDYAVSTSFSNIDGVLLSTTMTAHGGVDGAVVNPVGSTIVFLNQDIADSSWIRADATFVPDVQRRGIWQIQTVLNALGQEVVNLRYVSDIAVDNKIYIRAGNKWANTEFYTADAASFIQVPVLTAQYDTLYYQDSKNPEMCGRIKIVDTTANNIDVDADILGNSRFVSGNGIEFTNGLMVTFGAGVIPAEYADKVFVVEGVGKSITLIDYATLVSPEPGVTLATVPWDSVDFSYGKFDELNLGPQEPDYIVSNRGSLDLNAWARQNRWFHIDVIVASAAANNIVPRFDQAVRAQRPIIEFDASIQLFNTGRIGKTPLDQIDTTITDAFNQVQHSKFLGIPDLPLAAGQRVLFANDRDPLVRSQVYTIQYALQNEPSFQSVYDGILTGTIEIPKPILNFVSLGTPVDLTPEITDAEVDHTYTWTVSGNSTLMGATLISGLDWPDCALRGTIYTVDDLGNGTYSLTFTTNYPLHTFINSGLSILGSAGTSRVTGTNSKFLSELQVGSVLYNNKVYIGRVESIASDTNLHLSNNATTSMLAATIDYREPRVQLLISADPEDALLPFDNLVAVAGINKGVTYWYNGNTWSKAQQKFKNNQAPLFDAFNSAGTSFSDIAEYPLSKFIGTPVFSYKSGVGRNDTVLGFPLSYSNTNATVADITFNNNFDTDTFDFLVNGHLSPLAVNSGVLRCNTGRDSFDNCTVWTTALERSKQYQIINKTYTGRTDHFVIDILPTVAGFVPTLKVFLNNVLLLPTWYVVGHVGAKNTIKINSTLLSIGDKIDILIYSNSVSNDGYYQIPVNLEFNSKNELLSTLQLGQLRNHLSAIGQNTNGINGSVPGVSNIRDLNIKANGGNILQQSAPTIYASLFLISEQANFINGLDYARRDYTKFKNKFLEVAATLSDLNHNDVAGSVDTILTSINLVKNKSFSWYYSDMVPYGKYTAFTYTVIKEADRQYKINSIYNDSVLQSRAILVYLNNRLMVKGQDYTFDQLRPAIHIADSVSLTLKSTIEIREYDTDGNYIPETPTKLGLYPKFLPSILTDDTYRITTDVLQGHDGSLTPTFGDFRDQFLLELECRIYNNIKAEYVVSSEEVNAYVPGRFRATDYSLNEFNQILSTGFMKWAGANRIDYMTNSYFESNDPFSYNYKYTTDCVFGQALPGYWRGIYCYFYDTDRPHSHPWEMLGFTEQPTWWNDTYGAAPYTSGNTILWDDLELGKIQQGPRTGIASKYARPGLSKIIPVDAQGNLRAPQGLISTSFNSSKAAGSFAIGDRGPVESAWRKTSEYPFALQQAIAIMKPALYFGTLFDTSSYLKTSVTGQYSAQQTLRRVTPNSIVLNGELVNGEITRASGYVNYVLGYLTSLGIDATTKVRTLLSDLDVQLTYKVAGYTDTNYLSVLAEQYSPTSTNQSVIIPNESYTIHLNKSVPIERVAYSAVIVEKTKNGFAVSGYNTNNPYFIIVPSDTAGTSYTVTVEKLSGVIYNDYKKQKLSIPYGHEFTSRQQLVDFLVSYQRYLISQGFIFDEYNQDLSAMQDWILSVKEFLTWSLQGWNSGSVLVLSPCGPKLKLISSFSIVDNITNDTAGSKLLDPNFTVIRTNDLMLLREPEQFTLQATSGQTVAFAELNLTQYEHVLVFDNTTVFGDVIYKPELGSRQFRLKLVGDKTANWTGALNPPGFIYSSQTVAAWRPGNDYLKGDLVLYKNLYYVATQKIAAQDTFVVAAWKQTDKSNIKTGLLRNFSNNAGKFNNIYDVDSTILDKEMARMSAGLIGYRERGYLTDLNISKTSATKFYQGYIRDKGTKNAIDALQATEFNNLRTSITYYEEWAVRVGEYGAQLSNQTVEIQIDDSQVTTNPAGFAIIDDYKVTPSGLTDIRNRDLYSRPFNNLPVTFLNRDVGTTRENDIQTAGYVNLNDVDSMLFDSAAYSDIADKIVDISSGFTIWVAKDANTDWQVYRASETDNTVVKVEYALDRRAKVTTKNSHNLAANQTVLIKQLNASIDGFYSVIEVTDLNSFTVAISAEQTLVLRTSAISDTGYLFLLSSSRFDSPSSIAHSTPLHGWKDGDLAWVDSDINGKWAVYKKTTPWQYKDALILDATEIDANSLYGSSAAVDYSSRYSSVGAPGYNNGIGGVWVYLQSKTNMASLLPAGPVGTRGLGTSVAVSDSYLVAGAPESESQCGSVIVYHTDGTYFNISQVITSPMPVMNAKFGYSVSVSQDNRWLYIGSPGIDTVYLYELTSTTAAKELWQYTYSAAITATTGSASQFGFSIKTSNDGSMLTVGAPSTTINSIVNAGAAYVYARNGNTSLYLLSELTADTVTYRAKFGSSVSMGNGNGSIYVGAPGYSDISYSGGAVYRFVNAGLVSGTVVGSATNAIVTKNDSLIINNQLVLLSGGNVDTVVVDINSALIPGVTAINLDGRLSVSSTIEIEFNKLNIVPGTGIAATTLGLRLFNTAQKIVKPIPTQGDNFGTNLAISSNSGTLLVASTSGTSETYSVLDSKTSTFDGSATRFLDIVFGSGAVYIHDFLPSKLGSNTFGSFGFTGEFAATATASGDKFGSALAINDNLVVIGASFNDARGLYTGSAYRYINSNESKGWNVIRSQQDKVDPTSINRMFLYDNKKNAILTTLDYIDPAKGKVLGIVDQDLDFKSSHDPAAYNAGTAIGTSDIIDYYWSTPQVGKTWWNLAQTRFVDYEQAELNYRMNNWGKVFPGSSIGVYEWVLSSVIPSRYVSNGGAGTPLYADDSAYVAVSTVDSVTNIIKIVYYFWVQGLTTVPAMSNRLLSVRSLADAIENPTAQNIPYAAVLSNSSVSLINCQPFFLGANTVLQINYDTVLNNNLLHSEYALVQEGNAAIPMPLRIVDKLVDSLSRQDAAGALVPDINLRPAQQTGLSLRPRQSLILNADLAMKNIAEYANSVFVKSVSANKLQNSAPFTSLWFYRADQLPLESEYDFKVADLLELSYVKKSAGVRVLVINDSTCYNLWTLYVVATNGEYQLIKNQAYDTTKLWDFAAWYASDFVSATKPTYIVAEYIDIAKLSIVAGDIVKVTNIKSAGGFALYQFSDSVNPVLVGMEYGTLVINNLSWDSDHNQVGFDNQTFDTATFDINYAIEIRNMLNGLKDDILIGDLADEYNRLLFVIVNYILSEQQSVDWIFKTSFINVLHNIRQLEQFPNYVKDDQTYYANYIDEVKPYRTKVREYKLGYSKIDTAPTHITDFDLPGYYDSALGRFCSPAGEILAGMKYRDWSNNFLNKVDRITINNAGSGYTIPPKVSIISTAGSGSGATAIAIIDAMLGTITNINVTNPGSGYLTSPLVHINGTGNGATAYAVVNNSTTRSITTKLKFDRVSYTTDVVEWLPTIAYIAGSRVSYLGRGYIATSDIAASQLFNTGVFVLISDSTYTTANDRIAANYNPTGYQLQREFDTAGKLNLDVLVQGISNPNYAIEDSTVVGNDTLLQSAPLQDSQSIDSPPAINVTGGKFYDKQIAYSPEELVPGVTFDNLNMQVFTKLATSTVGFRITNDIKRVVAYTAICGENITTLANSLQYDDTEIYVVSTAGLSKPNGARLTPGIIFINGEKITYFGINSSLNKLFNIRRGVDGTGTPLLHVVGTPVESAGPDLIIPETTKVATASYKFNKNTGIFKTKISVATDIDVVNQLLTVWISKNQLEIAIDYTVSIINGTAVITFTDSARSRFPAGIRINAKYTEDSIWLNPGFTTLTDGSGLEGSTTQAATFLKNNPYIYA